MEETINEDGRKTQVFKDFLQRVVLERVPDDDTLNIYYIYNNKNQLTYILTPEYQERGYKELFAYEYRYDSHGRLEKSERPHCNVEQNYYDTDGRVIYRQDAMGVFWFYFYDTMGRQVIKGTCSNFNYHHYRNVSMQSGQDGLFGTGYVYSYPTTLTRAIPVEVLFYDDYQFLGKSMFTSSPYCSGLTKTNPANATGLQTGSIQRTSSGEYLLTAIYYDEKGRVADLRETLADGGIKTTETTYTFTDKPQTETSTIVKNGSSTVIVKLMTYHNYNDQLETISFAFNGSNPVTVASYDYDDFGRIQTIQRGGNAGNVSYDYNLRGWTTSIDGKGFKEWLHYTDGHGTPYYSGNISSQLWKVDNENFKRGYRFSYNGFGWMHRADYAEGDDQDSHQDRYSEYISEYRLGGSVRKIERFGKKSDGKYGKIDNLRLYYNGLQVDSVKEDALPLTYTGAFDFVSKTISTNGPQYTYYDDGSLRWDANKGVSKIEYDRNRYPHRVQFSNGNVTEYVYSPEGEKIKAVYYTAVPNISVGLGQTLTLNTSNTLTVDSVCYVGNLIFENGQLSKFLFEGGYATFTNGQPVYHYYTKDHLGNNRAVVNHNGSIEQIVHYYPFGAVYSDAGTNDGLQRYKYNGKELDRMHGLNLYDYGARNYDPLLCRFTQIDPLCEKNYSMNPYAYCGNNPVNAIDSNGKDWVRTQNSSYIWMDNVTSPNCIPYGYNYIGRSGEDILADLNIKTQHAAQSSNKISFGLDGDEKFGGAIVGSSYVLTGSINVTAMIDINPHQGTDNNIMGITFRGIKLEAFLNQKGYSPNPNTVLNYKGNMNLEMNGNVEYVPFSSSHDLQIQQKGSISQKAVKEIPAYQIKNGFTIRQISIEAGATNSGSLFNLPIVFTWNLMSSPIIKSK